MNISWKKSFANAFGNRSRQGEGERRLRPEENMHPWKMKRLARVVQTYLIHKRIGNRAWQFDLMLVYLQMDDRTARVKVMENIIL